MTKAPFPVKSKPCTTCCAVVFAPKGTMLDLCQRPLPGELRALLFLRCLLWLEDC